MVRALWAIVAWAVIGVTGVIAQTTARLPGGSWSFTLPANWKIVDDATLERMNRQVQQTGVRVQGGPLQYVMMAASQEGDGCYLVVQWSAAPPANGTFDAFVKGVEQGMGKELNDVQRQMKGKVSGATLDAPEVDRERKHVILTGRMDAAGVGGMKYFTCPTLGSAETITLHLYAPEGTFESKRAQFRGIIDSFAFDAGKEYDFAASSGFDVGRVGMMGLIGAGVGLLVWVVRKVSSR
ncbi:MAG: hypothetical protein QM783_02105 [Phycisphaerales bacterium]